MQCSVLCELCCVCIVLRGVWCVVCVLSRGVLCVLVSGEIDGVV